MKNDNVIDLSERRPQSEEPTAWNSLKMRFEVERGKIMVSTSLISIVLLVTLANNSLVGKGPGLSVSSIYDSSSAPSRAIASVPTGTSEWEDKIHANLSKMSLKEKSGIGRQPSSLDSLTFGFLEGKYAVRLQNGKIHELEFADAANSGDRPKYISDRARFLMENRELLPVHFDKSVRASVQSDNERMVESYDLVDGANKAVGKVEFRMDPSGRLLAMKVDVPRLAAK